MKKTANYGSPTIVEKLLEMYFDYTPPACFGGCQCIIKTQNIF